MKSTLKIIIVSLTCSILSIIFYSIYLNSTPIEEEKTILHILIIRKAFVNTSGINNLQYSNNAGLPDLTFAAKKSINAVVHVKTHLLLKKMTHGHYNFLWR